MYFFEFFATDLSENNYKVPMNLVSTEVILYLLIQIWVIER